jgi:hypothetical protein
MERDTQNISGQPVTFLGQSVWDLHNEGYDFQFFGSITPTPYYEWPWFYSSIPYAAVNQGYWGQNGFTNTGSIVWNYTINVADYFVAGTQPSPTTLVGSLQTDTAHDDLYKYDYTVSWNQYAWAEITLPSAEPTVSVSGPSKPVLEGSIAQFTISLDHASSSSVTANYTTADGAAISGTDYSAETGSITFAAGETSKTVSVPVLFDATVDTSEMTPDQSDSAETFQIKLTSASGAIIGTSSATASIQEGSLFTPGADTVDFNNLTTAQQQAIAAGADTTHGLGGNDNVTLPNSGSATFYTGSTTNDTNYQVTGGGGNYTIFEGAGKESISINGNGNSNITAGSGSDTITISGTGHSIITPGLGTLNATIGGGGTVELTSTTAPVAGSITFAPGTNETLQIDGSAMPANTIYGFKPGETIDLAGVPYNNIRDSAVLQSFSGPNPQNNVLSVTESGSTYNLQIDPAQSFANEQFILSYDGHHGTDVTINPGLDLNLTFDQGQTGLPKEFIQGVDIAAYQIEQTFKNIITINERIGYGEYLGAPLKNQAVAEAAPQSGVRLSFPELRKDLTEKGGVPATWLPQESRTLDAMRYYVSSAEEKAFGLLSSKSTVLDGAVAIGKSIQGDNIISVALHELTHAMGRFVSSTSFQRTSYDIFRYSGRGHNQFNTGNVGARPPVQAPPSYFSLDGGKTHLADFGRKSDPADFLNGGVQDHGTRGSDPFDEFYGPSTSSSLTNIDILSMRALGFAAGNSTGGSSLTNTDLSSPPQQTSLLWGSNAKLHAEMVAGLHDALVPTTNDTPLLYDNHSTLFRQALVSFGTNDLSTAFDSLLPTQNHRGFHQLATNDTHTFALTRAASSTEAILAVPHHG